MPLKLTTWNPSGTHIPHGAATLALLVCASNHIMITRHLAPGPRLWILCEQAPVPVYSPQCVYYAGNRGQVPLFCT